MAVGVSNIDRFVLLARSEFHVSLLALPELILIDRHVKWGLIWHTSAYISSWSQQANPHDISNN